MYGISGSILTAWALSIGWIAYGPFRRGEKWAWTAISVSLLTWFVGNSYISIFTRFPLHAGLNVSLLVVMGIPLLATYRLFHAS